MSDTAATCPRCQHDEHPGKQCGVLLLQRTAFSDAYDRQCQCGRPRHMKPTTRLTVEEVTA